MPLLSQDIDLVAASVQQVLVLISFCVRMEGWLSYVLSTVGGYRRYVAIT
jgi:hypothetical protein